MKAKISLGIFLMILLTGLLIFSACAPTIYGIPEEQWNRMSESQKQTAMEDYNERERVLKIERQKQAEIEAREAAIRADEERHREEVRKKRIDAIYRGEAGQYGDLIRVTIQEGEMKIAGTHRDYYPVSFKMADGEIKQVHIVHAEGKFGTADDLHVLYEGGVLYIDTNNSEKGRAARFAYDKEWKRGKTYTAVNARGRLAPRNVRVSIEIIPHLTRNRIY